MNAEITRRTRIALASGILAACAMLGPDYAAAGVNRSGTIGKFDGVDGISFACTAATSFVNMPDMSRTFTLPAGGNASVLVMFEGALSISNSDVADTGFLRLVIDNQIVGPGDQVPAIALESGSGFESEDDGHGFTWQTKPLTPGSHTARILYRTDQGSNLCVDARSLIVLHK